MKELEALEIIRALADGIDPYTGEVFPTDSPYQNAQTVRALFTAIDAIETTAKKKERKKTLPERAGKPWDNEELELLIKRFDDGFPINEMARAHKRTILAIESRLMKMGKIPPRSSGIGWQHSPDRIGTKVDGS